MELSDKDYLELRQVHRIKKKQVRIIKREKPQSQNELQREISLSFGSVWGIDDISVPFDNKRREDDYKNSLRPSLVLQTPDTFKDYSTVRMAPGTSKFHNSMDPSNPCLRADRLREEMDKTTYFLLYFEWTAVQKTLRRKFCELSAHAKAELQRLIDVRET